jgi:hypothetical protein
MKTDLNGTRRLDAIHMRPAQNQQGGQELMDLNSGKLITWNMLRVLSLRTAHGVAFQDSDWIAGVDWDDDNKDEEADDDEACHHEA